MCVDREVENHRAKISSTMARGGKMEMTNARGQSRCVRGREYPAFLTCLIMMVTMMVLLHSTCTSSGSAYSLLHFNSLVTRPASILSRLDILTPTKERPPTLLIDSGATTAPSDEVEAHRSFAAVGPEPAADVVGNNSTSNSPTSNGSQLGRLESLETAKSVLNGTNLSAIFEELQACKQAISEATLESVDPSLYSILYRNMTAFSKSYELMERVFKVYTYPDGGKPLVHSGPLTGVYASEGQFIERMKHASQYLTDDPLQAHMFFLPYSVQQMVTHLYVPNSRSMLPLATFIKEYVEALARRYPFWNRTQGADHFFVSCHDWGPATTRDHPTLRRNAVKVVCNADLSDGLFVLGKDASLPEVYVHNPKTKLPTLELDGPSYDKRPYLAFFAGQMHGRVRPILLHHWKDKDPEMKIYEVLPKSIARNVSYIQHMQLSKYCICAMGYEVNSPRIVEAIYYDCVPVIIADNFVLPFSDVLNWDAFSVTVPESEIPNLKNVLSGISDGNYMSMQMRLRKVRRHFVWHEAPEKYDVFNMILHSVWTSRLNHLEQIREASGVL